MTAAGWSFVTRSSAAERVAREGCEQLEQLGERAWLSTQECQLGETMYALGRFEEAERWATLGLEHGGTDDVLTQTMGLQLRAKLLARRGQSGAALSLAKQADQLARSPLVQGDAALTMAEVLYLAGKLDESEAETRRAVDCYEQKGAPACVMHALELVAGWKQGRPA